jgi:hypothetical protein
MQLQGAQQLNNNIKKYLDEVATKRERQKVLLAGAKVLRNAARLNIDDSPKPHYYYPKNGKGRIQIKPGNLRKSMYAYKERSGVVSVGPRYIRRVTGVLKTLGETPKTSSGFYAAMLFKSAQSFRQRVTETALASALNKIDIAMQKAYQRIHRQWAKKYGF